MNGSDDSGNDAVDGRRGDNAWIRWYDGSNDRLLELFADIHHPSEPAEYVGKERPIDFVNSKHLLHDPRTEIRIRRDT